MNEKELIKEIMLKEGIGNAQLAKRIGITTQAMWDRLNNPKNKSLMISVASQILNAMDYKLVIVPSDKTVKEGYGIK